MTFTIGERKPSLWQYRQHAQHGPLPDGSAYLLKVINHILKILSTLVISKKLV